MYVHRKEKKMALEDSFPSRLACIGCKELRPLFPAEDSYKHHAPRPLRLSLFFVLSHHVLCAEILGGQVGSVRDSETRTPSSM